MGNTVNAPLRAPRSSNYWVNERECSACGERYSSFKAGVRFSDGVALVRTNNGPSDEAGKGGYRSRGPVLWAMRVIKLGHWYIEHRDCERFVSHDNEMLLVSLCSSGEERVDIPF